MTNQVMRGPTPMCLLPVLLRPPSALEGLSSRSVGGVSPKVYKRETDNTTPVSVRSSIHPIK